MHFKQKVVTYNQGLGGRARPAGTLFRNCLHLIDTMQTASDEGDDARQISDGSVIGDGQDSDDGALARDTEEDFSLALKEFKMESEKLNSESEDDGSYSSEEIPSHAESGMEEQSDLGAIDSDCEIAESDGEQPTEVVIAKLSRLAPQIARTVEKLRKDVFV